MISRLHITIAFVLLTGSLGCGSGASNRPKVVPTIGRVLFNGQPVADAHVTFTNPEANRSAYARTDSEGKFALTTFEPNDGAVPGKQQISVSKVQAAKPLDPAVDRTTIENAPAASPSDRHWLIPRHYGSPATSGLTAVITEDGPNDIVLELKGAAER